MTIPEIINKISALLPLTKDIHDQWVWVISEALKKLCGQKETLIQPTPTDYHHKCFSDILLPNGCKAMGWEECTIVEFKMRLIPDIYSLAKRMLDEMSGVHDITPKQCVMIVNTPPSQDLNKNLFNPELYGRTVIVNSLYYLLENNSTFREAVESVIKSNETEKYDWEKEQQKRIEDAKWSFSTNKVTLFLGAGVSMSMNMPSWPSLLKQLLDKNHVNPDMKHIKSGDYESIEEACGHSSIITGRYATMGLKDKDKDIHEALYKNIDKTSSSLVSAICDAIGKASVESVITYNYDDVIEEELKLRKKSHSSIYGGMRCYWPDKPIYHVHGILPHKVPFYSKVVLSEDEYHEIYREAYHWSNIEQLHALCRNTCFFIGLSMTDPSLRRLCDIAMNMGSFELKNVNNDVTHTSEAKAVHYAFLPRKSFKEGCDNCPDCFKNTEHFDIMERMMLELGITVIWYKSHNDLPDLIKQIVN